MTHGFTAARNLIPLTLIAGTLLVPLCAPAGAAEWDTIPAYTVKYDDLNLSTRKGAEALYRRITAAAYQVCWPQNHGELSGDVALHTCVRKAAARAVAEINNPLLTAIHDHSPLPGPLATVPTKRE